MHIEEYLARIGSEKRIHYALDTFESALKDVGSPNENVKSIVITGTNGKGSTTLFTSSILKAQGLNVATYLSPHLQSIRERCLWNMEPVSQTVLDSLASRHYALAEKHRLSYFEFMTLLFFIWAKEQKADIVVLEVGVGGRLDATNVTTPIATAITSIGLDHEALLGSTLPQILGEKLGVCRPAVPLVTAVTEASLFRQITEDSKTRAFPVVQVNPNKIETLAAHWDSQTVQFDGVIFSLPNPNPKMAENALVAYTLIRTVFPEISAKTIQKGFNSVRTPGRFETVAESPRIILSGDHNPEGMASLTATIARLPKGKIHTLCAFSPDKPAKEMIEVLKSISTTLTLTEVYDLKSKRPDGYTSLHSPFIENAKEAVQCVVSQAAPSDTVLITGSLYLIGEIRSLWFESVSFQR